MKSTVILSTLLGALVLSPASPAQGAPKEPAGKHLAPQERASGDPASQEPRIEELQREVRALEARLQVLDTAARELAQLTVRTAEFLSRVLSDEGDATPIASERAKPSTTASAPRRVPRAPKDLGTVRGRVKLPEGEPIAYVYVENVFAPPVRGKKVVIDQKNKSFTPGWAVVRRGTTIEFPNRDNIYHNVFSHASGNSFDLGLYNSASPAKAHTFQSAGAADIYCNIHPSMAASVLVVPNDLYAKVRADGTFDIEHVPSGQRKIVAWSPGSAPATQWVELSANGTADVELTLVPKSRVHKNKAGQAYGSYE